MINFIKEDENYLYVNKSESTPENLKGVSEYCKEVNKKLIDLENNEHVYISKHPKTRHLFLKPSKKARFNKSEVKQVVIDNNITNATQLKKALKVSITTAITYIEKYNLKPIMDKIRIETIDVVEDKLYTLAKNGDVKAIKMYLEAKAKDRGYGNNQNTVDANVNVKLVFEDIKE